MFYHLADQKASDAVNHLLICSSFCQWLLHAQLIKNNSANISRIVNLKVSFDICSDVCFYDFTDTGCNNVVNQFTTTSVHHCQSSCFSNAAFSYFTFDKISKWCYLKDSIGCNATNVNRISGPKICGYMNGNFCLHFATRNLLFSKELPTISYLNVFPVRRGFFQ